MVGDGRVHLVVDDMFAYAGPSGALGVADVASVAVGSLD